MISTKQTLTAYALFILTTFSASAQVTIGSAAAPVQGSILDLKEKDGPGINSSKGLLLPRVVIPELTTLTIAPEDEKDEHIGAMVYAIAKKMSEQPTEELDPCVSIPLEEPGAEGVMLWTGTKWTPLLPQKDETTDPSLPSWVHPDVKLTKPDQEQNSYTYRYFGNPDHKDMTLEEFVAKGGTAADYKNFGYWMTENLRSTKYGSNRPGVELSLVQSSGGLPNLLLYGYPRKLPKNNTPAETNMQTDIDFKEHPSMGLLYSAGAIAGAVNGSISVTPNLQGICPDGWFLPSKSDWGNLIDYLDTPEQRALYATYDTHPVDPYPTRTMVTGCNKYMEKDAVISSRGKTAQEGAFALTAVGWGNVTTGAIFNNRIFEYPETPDTGTVSIVNIRAGSTANPPNNTVFYTFPSQSKPLGTQMISVRCRTNINPEQ